MNPSSANTAPANTSPMNTIHQARAHQRHLITLATLLAVASGGIACFGLPRPGFLNPPQAPSRAVRPVKITALGRLEPEQEVIKLSVPAEMVNERMARLLIRRGDRVQAGQVIAVLDSHDRLQKAVLEAREQVRVAQSRLAQIRAGAKTGEIAARRAEILRFQAELQGEQVTRSAEIRRRVSERHHAKAEYERHRYLAERGAVSSALYDQKRLALFTSGAQLQEAQSHRNLRVSLIQAQLQQARATLDQIAEVRPVDVRPAQLDVQRALAALERSKAEMEQSVVRSPQAGRVLEIHAKPGETVSQRGIADVGQTDRMQVVAEVYQSDIGRIRVGQRAEVTGESFAGALRGTVHDIGLMVSQQETLSQQPGENLDQRIVKVRLRLHPADSRRVASLTNLQVQAAIQP